MARLSGNQNYRGRIGGLVIYDLNGEPVVREKRSKLSKGQKAKAQKTAHGKAAKGNVKGSKFGAALREFRAFQHQADTMYHSAMTGYITRQIMTRAPEEGGPGTRALLAENIHKISSFTANSEFPSKVLDALRKTTFKQWEGGLTALVPKMPIEMLVGSKADHYRVWVRLKYIDIKDMRAGWSLKIFGEPVVFGEKVSHSIAFNPPQAQANEVLMAIVGVQSLKKGNMVEDVRMNGFVYLAVGNL